MAVTALLAEKKCAGHIGHEKALTLSRRARAMKYVCSYEAGEVARSSVSERCLRGVLARLHGRRADRRGKRGGEPCRRKSVYLEP